MALFSTSSPVFMSQLQDRIAGALAGMVLGDAFGVPGELWPRAKVRERFGRITEFLDGPADNIVACYFKAGHYTDDSAQAFVVLNGFEINLLGPSSKASLLAWVKGEDALPVTKLSLTNGAAMRIAPVGCLIEAGEHEKIAEAAARVSRVTHSTDVTIAGAAMVAQAVASGVAGRSWEQTLADVKTIFPIASAKGEPTWAASILARLEVFEELVLKRREAYDDEAVSRFIYDVIGTGTMTSESVTAALALAFWAQNPKKAAEIAANMGGDTDTIGCMAAAICGAHCGIGGIAAETVEFLEKTNGLHFGELAQGVMKTRAVFTL